jgi:hypothetical protein
LTNITSLERLPWTKLALGAMEPVTPVNLWGLLDFRGMSTYEMGMTCMDCHPVNNFHGTGEVNDSMWTKEELPSCYDCHENQQPGQSELQVHNIHTETVSCQVCHAQANNNCFECHVEYNDDKTGLASSSDVRLIFRIGKNPIPSETSTLRVCHPASHTHIR